MAGVALAFAVLEVSDSAAGPRVRPGRALDPARACSSSSAAWSRTGCRATWCCASGSLVLAATQGVVAYLVITDVAEIWMLVVLEAINGTVMAIVFPAYAGIIPQLVPRDQLQQANVLQAVARGSTRVLGPSIAGLLVVGVGPGWALAVDALTWLAAGPAAACRSRCPRRTGAGRRPRRSASCARAGCCSAPRPGCGWWSRRSACSTASRPAPGPRSGRCTPRTPSARPAGAICCPPCPSGCWPPPR